MEPSPSIPSVSDTQDSKHELQSHSSKGRLADESSLAESSSQEAQTNRWDQKDCSTIKAKINYCFFSLLLSFPSPFSSDPAVSQLSPQQQQQEQQRQQQQQQQAYSGGGATSIEPQSSHSSLGGRASSSLTNSWESFPKPIKFSGKAENKVETDIDSLRSDSYFHDLATCSRSTYRRELSFHAIT